RSHFAVVRALGSVFFFASRRRHTRFSRDWSSDVCSSDLYQCGPASLAMVLNHRGVAATPDSLKDRVYLPERKGTLQVEMISAARERDLLVYPLDKDLQAIL